MKFVQYWIERAPFIVLFPLMCYGFDEWEYSLKSPFWGWKTSSGTQNVDHRNNHEVSPEPCNSSTNPALLCTGISPAETTAWGIIRDFYQSKKQKVEASKRKKNTEPKLSSFLQYSNSCKKDCWWPIKSPLVRVFYCRMPIGLADLCW